MPKKVTQFTLAEGETTGHSHKLVGDISVLDEKNKIFSLTNPTPLYHEEHNPIEIPQGNWCSDIVQEFDHVQQKLRKVID